MKKLVKESLYEDNRSLASVNVSALTKHGLPDDTDSIKVLNKTLRINPNKSRGLAKAVGQLIDMIGVDVNVEEVMDVFNISKKEARDAIDDCMFGRY